jgi:putative ABC transport system permease protein
MREYFHTIWQDLRFAARSFGKRPGFTAVAILSLALGIGATTAVFSIFDAVLLRPLPYKHSSRLAAVWITSTRENGLAKLFATYGDYLEFRRHATTLENVAAASWGTPRTGRVLTGRGAPLYVLTIPASASFFELLGVPAAIGRTFVDEDEGRGCSLVLAHNFWASALAAGAAVVNQILILDQQPCRVLGVMPEGFAFYPRQTQAWVLLEPGFQPDQDRMLAGIFGLLKPGVTLAQAQAELHGLFRAIHHDAETRDFEPIVYDLHGEFTFLAGRNLRTTLIVVFAAVGLLLLIACLNVANLVLSRMSERQRELALRAALGSGASRLIRQVLSESLLLSIAGTLCGLVIAYAGILYFRHVNPIELGVGADVAVNLPVLLFAAALSIVSTLLFGLLPALRASKVDLARHLKASGRCAAAHSRGLARSVAAVEMALSFILLMGASLLVTSALRMASENLGFDPNRVIAMRLYLPAARYSTNAERRGFYERVLERLESESGLAVTLASKVPPEAGGNQVLEIRDRLIPCGSEVHDVGADAVSPGFFRVLGIPLRYGRAFSAQDREDSLPVAIVNDALVREYFRNSDPLGQQIRLPGGNMPWLTIVGVAGNLKHTELMNEMRWVETPILYRPLAQEPRPVIQLAVRSSGDLAGLEREIRNQIATVDASVPIPETGTLASRLSTTLGYQRFRAIVLTLFATGALLLSAMGLHGVLSQIVAQRMREFGVRRAVGARTLDLLALVFRQSGIPVIFGIAIGVCGTLSVHHAVASLLYEVQPTDPSLLALVSLGLGSVAAVATLPRAIRAALVDPMIALRDE